jgi:hypothetical protein
MASTSSQCKSCGASNLVPGLVGLDVEPIFAFPKLTICLSCGFAQSNLSEKKLKQLKDGAEKSNGASA